MIRKNIIKIINKNIFLAKIMYGLKDAYQSNLTFVLTQWGFRLAGNNQMALGDYEKIETKKIRELLNDNDIMINVGANIGYYCLHALVCGKYVVAIEPNRYNASILMQNIIENKFEEKIELYQLALDSDVGIVRMWGGGTGASLQEGWSGISKNYHNLVPLNTMDNIISSRFDGKKILVVIDAEGSEYNILKGSHHILKSGNKISWFIEITTTQNQPNNKFNENFINTFDLFYNYGYTSYAVSNELIEIKREDIINIVNKKTKYEYHNFYFKKNSNENI